MTEKEIKQPEIEKEEKPLSAKTSKKGNVKEIQREYIIPLREKIRVVPRYKKTNKAVKTVKEFLARHMQVRDRDLNKIKLDSYLNQFLWGRGIKNPPHKVKVKAIKQGDIVRVELADFPKVLAVKKAQAEKLEKTSQEKIKKKKEVKSTETEEKKDIKEEEEKEKIESEKKAALVEAGQKLEKSIAKQMKHTSKASEKQSVPQRKISNRY